MNDEDVDLDRDEIIEEDAMPEGVDVDDVDEPAGVTASTKKKKSSKIAQERGSTDIPEDGSLSAQRLMEQQAE